MKTQLEIRLKVGKILPSGLPVTFDKEKPWIAHVTDSEKTWNVRVASAFRAPCTEELESAVMDGVCESIAGHSVEPDGWDSQGTPSWLLALGLI